MSNSSGFDGPLTRRTAFVNISESPNNPPKGDTTAQAYDFSSEDGHVTVVIYGPARERVVVVSPACRRGYEEIKPGEKLEPAHLPSIVWLEIFRFSLSVASGLLAGWLLR